MNKLQYARLNSYTLGLDHIDSNIEIAKTVPALITAAGNARVLANTSKFTDQKILQKINGLSDDKLMDQEQLTTQAIVISSAISAFASMNNDAALREAMNFNWSELFYGQDKRLEEQCNNILQTAEELGSKLDNFGITPALLDSFKQLIKEYSTSKDGPRNGISTRKANVIMVDRLLKELKRVMEQQVDLLMQQFRLTHRTFYDEYWAKRAIVDPYTRSTRAEGIVVDATSGKPLKGVVVLVENAGISCLTDASGRYSMKIPLTGTVMLSFKKEGYQPAQMEIKLKKGRLSKANQSMTIL